MIKFNQNCLRKAFLVFIVAIALRLSDACAAQTAPTVITFVIDQFAGHYLFKARPFLNHGLAKLFDHGISFNDATYPHATPSTPTGHAALATGTFAYVHGISNYGWINEKNEHVHATDDNSPEALVFAKSGLHDFGASAKNLMADTICDQFAMSSEPPNPAHAYAFSLKPRSSIMLAGSKGKAVWFDEIDGGLTSSKAYFQEIPYWLKKVNRDFKPRHKACYRWNSNFNRSSKAYNFHQARNYAFTASGESIIGKKFKINVHDKEPFKQFLATPFADILLFEAAKACIRHHLNINEHRHSRLLVFISLSSFDFSGHLFGPDSLEQIDMLYQLDKQIGKFINQIQVMAGRKNVLFAVTADHGVMPIPEIMNQKGFNLPERIDVNSLIAEINELARREFGVSDIVKLFEAPEIFLDKVKMASLCQEKREQLLAMLKNHIKSKPYIRECWTIKDLERTHNGCRNKYQVLFAKQTFSGRTGDLICMVQPYKMLTKYPTGTSHATPYRYDTHVPLAFYQTGVYDQGLAVQQPVSMLQFAGSLARILNCPAPSCARCPILPGLFRL